MTQTDAWKLDRIGSARVGTNPTVLAKLPASYAVIGDAQFLPGYCVLLVDDPSIDRLTDLPKRQRLEFLDSMDTLGQAVENACRAVDPAFRRIYREDRSIMSMPVGEARDRLSELAQRHEALGRYL